MKHNISICCILKNERVSDVLEWVEYHKKIGVEHFWIYDNESEIPVNSYLNDKSCSIYKIIGSIKQFEAYSHCITNHKNESNWIAFIDIDEFITLKTETGLAELLEGFIDYGGLAINWQVFGSSGHIKFQDSVLKNFTKQSETNHHLNMHVKTIVNTKYILPKVDNPHIFHYDNNIAVNENKDSVQTALMNVSVNKIQINHYWCKSKEDWMLKMLRGYSDCNRQPRSWKDFEEKDAHLNMKENTK